MPTELTLAQIAKEAPRLIQAGASVELRGPPGCGKSDVVEQITNDMAKRTGKPWGFAVLNASTALPITVPGFPLFSQKNERGVRVTEHTEPVWMTCRDGKSVHDYEHGILLIDEISSAEGDIKKQLAELQLSGRAGNHQLPGFGKGGWSVWATGNRTSDRSGVTKDFDFRINRRVEIHIRQDIEALIDHWAGIGVHPMTMAFYQQNPQIVLHDSVPDTQGPWATPRSAVLADKLMRAYADPTNPDQIIYSPVLMALMAGYLGDGAANQLAAFLKMANAAVQFKDIIADPLNCPLPEKPDMQMLTCYMCASRVDIKNVDAIVKYISRLPEEFAVLFVKSALKHDQQIINTKAVIDWCAKNATLMGVVVNLA
jgi:hypothetical protein